MAKASRRIKTLTINKSKDIVVDRLLKQCQDGAHQKCTGWAVLKKEISPIDANYFLKCTCACHRKKEAAKKQDKSKKRAVVVAKKVAVAKKKAKKGKIKGRTKDKPKRKQKKANKRNSKKKATRRR